MEVYSLKLFAINQVMSVSPSEFPTEMLSSGVSSQPSSTFYDKSNIEHSCMSIDKDNKEDLKTAVEEQVKVALLFQLR